MSAATGSRHGPDAAEFARAMGPVARKLLGEPTDDNRIKQELRFGTRGSLSVSLTKGTWFDHEAGEGGGVLDFVKTRKNLDTDGAIEWLQDNEFIAKKDKAKPGSKREVAAYNSTNIHGELLYQVVRFEPKDFRQRRPDGNGSWVWKMTGVTRVLYRLHELNSVPPGGRVYFVEGEKAADALSELGVIATCSPGGANKWRDEYVNHLVERDVVVLPDNDEPGRQHAAMAARSLRGYAQVRILDLPGLPEKGDVADWIAAGGTREALEALLPTAEPQTDWTASVNAVVADFNSRYVLVNENGKAVIYQQGYDPVLKRRRFDRLATRDLQTLYMNERIQIGTDEKDRPVYKGVADIWLRHPNRRQFIHGVTFDPSMQVPPGVLNLWEGFAIKSAPGDWSLMRKHIENIICDGDPIRFNYLIHWMARMVQRPAEQGEVAVVMQGGEGTGKGTLAKAMMHITGHHGLAISNGKHLVGNFNGHLRDIIFLFADEALFAGDRQHVGALKSLISEPYLTVEAKFANAVQAPNFLHVMMASNEAWVVPASHDARRFFVLDVSEAMKGDHTYFAAIWKQMDAGGYAAMLHDLLALDLTTFNVRSVPTTEGLQRQRKLSLQTTEAWWLDCLERGYVFRSRYGLEEQFGAWYPKISTELLFASYLEFAKARGERRPLSRESLGRFFATLTAPAGRWRNGVVGEHMVDVENLHGGTTRKAALIRQGRVCGHTVGQLQQARADFTRVTGLAITWDGGAPDEDAD
jgi:hypothetical protein